MATTAMDVLAFEESVQLDPRPIEALHEDIGPDAAEAVLRRAMRELAIRLERIEAREGIETMADLSRAARGIVGIASEVGMTTLSRVAADVAACADAATHQGPRRPLPGSAGSATSP